LQGYGFKGISMPETIEYKKLNLGCRTSRIPGFLNVDVDGGPFPEKDVEPDIIADASNMEMVESGSVDEVYASNILEHFPHSRTLEVLKEWNRVLKPGGVLWISVPDFEAILRLYKLAGNLNKWMINFMYGDQYHKYAFHYIIFTWANLQELLMEAGFTKFEKLVDLPYRLGDGSTLRDTWTKERVALNCKAVK
jgi:predicted SAM-dependent methyltransferase